MIWDKENSRCLEQHKTDSTSSQVLLMPKVTLRQFHSQEILHQRADFSGEGPSGTASIASVQTQDRQTGLVGAKSNLPHVSMNKDFFSSYIFKKLECC